LCTLAKKKAWCFVFIKIVALMAIFCVLKPDRSGEVGWVEAYWFSLWSFPPTSQARCVKRTWGGNGDFLAIRPAYIRSSFMFVWAAKWIHASIDRLRWRQPNHDWFWGWVRLTMINVVRIASTPFERRKCARFNASFNQKAVGNVFGLGTRKKNH